MLREYFAESNQDPAFIVEIAADGFGPKAFRVPVRMLRRFDHGLYLEKRILEKSERWAKPPGVPPWGRPLPCRWIRRYRRQEEAVRRAVDTP
jgi:hypothetical protein